MTYAVVRALARGFIFAGAGALLTLSSAQAHWLGQASYYSANSRVASGVAGRMTCAHRSLPFGTMLKVTNLTNRRAVVVRVNDRGPFIRGRIVDVSVPAAEALGMRRSGVAKVLVERMN